MSTTAVGSFGIDGEFTYKFAMKANEELDVSGVNMNNSFLTLDGITIPLAESRGWTTVVGQEVRVELTHIENMRSKPFYITIPAITKSTINNIKEDFIRSECSIVFEYYDGDGEYEILSVSPSFNIRTNLEEVKPELNNATKIIL